MVKEKITEKSDRFTLDDKNSQKIEELRQIRQSLDEQMYQDLDKAETLFKKLGTVDQKENVKKELSKIDRGLQQYGIFKETIADLAAGLTEGLEEYVQFAAKSKNYQGIGEKICSFIWKSKANRMRIGRLRNQNPRENLEQVLAYGRELVKEILEVRLDAVKTYQKLEVNTALIVQKIKEYQPKEEEEKEKLDAMEQEYKSLEEKSKTAEPKEQADLEVKKDELHKALIDQRLEYDKTLTIYNQAQQALEASKQSRDGFEQMVRDLGRQAEMVKQKIDNVTEIYLAAPPAVKILMTTKGMSQLDQTVNVATQKSVEMIIEATDGVKDETLKREEIQLIKEEVMRGFMDRMNQIMQDFNARYDKIRTQARRSPEERYGAGRE